MANNTPTPTYNYTLIAQVYEESVADVRHYFACTLRNATLAEDMTQDLFLRMLRLTTPIIAEAVKGLVFRMAQCMVIDHYRHIAFRCRVQESYKKAVVDTSTEMKDIECHDLEQWEQKAIATLSPMRAIIYNKVRFEDMQADAIAKELCLSRRTVENHIYSSRKIVRASLKKVAGWE